MRKITRIFIHCSDSYFGDASAIDAWHKQKGWNGIGYHFVVLNGVRRAADLGEPNNPLDDGLVEKGRSLTQVGAHVEGHNQDSIGICLIGKKHFTDMQIAETISLVKKLQAQFTIPVKNVQGHYEVDKKKTCPNIPMDWFRGKLG